MSLCSRKSFHTDNIEHSSNLSLSGLSISHADITVDYILLRLSQEELETAALASYEYLKNPILSEQRHHARKITHRYLTSKKNNEKAIKKLKATLEFRRKIDIVGLIKAFDKDINASGEYAIHLQKQLSSKKIFVQGYDKQKRATLYFIPRLVQGHDSEWTLKEAVYSIERAIACTKATDGLINAVVDFSGFSPLKHSPPMDIGRQFLTTLRNHYAGQIHRIYLMHTPRSFSLFWRMFKPFVGKATQDKIHIISARNINKLKESYDFDQAPSWMLPSGQKNRNLDLDNYLFKTPFNKAFDEQ